MTAGRRDQLITLQSYTATQDDYGEEVQTWAPLGTEWARVIYGRGAERRQAAQEQASQVATFEMVSNSRTRALLPRDRIVHLGYEWDILGPPALDTPRRGEVAVEAQRAV
jgi:head-tail adaptor